MAVFALGGWGATLHWISVIPLVVHCRVEGTLQLLSLVLMPTIAQRPHRAKIEQVALGDSERLILGVGH